MNEKKNQLRISESIAKFKMKAKMFLRKFSAMSKNLKNEFRMLKKMIQLSFDSDCKSAKHYSFILHTNEKIRRFDQ